MKHTEERKRKRFEEKETKGAKMTLDDVAGVIHELGEEINKTGEYKKKILMAKNKDQNPVIEAIDWYLSNLDESRRLEACHNLVKYLKAKINEMQKES